MDLRLSRQLTSSQERGEYLEKRSSGVFGSSSWTRYFFIVLGEQQVLRRTHGQADPRGSLLYYKSEEAFEKKEQPLDSMPLATCAITESPESERRGTYAFSLTSKQGVWQLRTVSETARLNWMTSLRSQQGTYLSSWSNEELLECLHNVGDRVITKDTRDAIKKSRFTGQDISDFFKEAWKSRQPQQTFRDSLEKQLGNLSIRPEQTDELWRKLDEILVAAADSEHTDEAAASEDLQLSLKVLRWMYVKDQGGSKKYVAYELQVMAPFASEAGARREMDTRTYLQRWSQLSRFNDKFKQWAQKTAHIAGTTHMFDQQISWKMFKDLSDPRALETRKVELNDYLSKLAHWANEAADKRLINLPTLIDEVVDPCFGADAGGRSPMGKRTSENLQEADQVYAGWLNLVRKKKIEPYHAVLACAAVTGKDSRTIGCDKGTFALYHGPKDRHAELVIPLAGAFVTGCEEVGADSADRSPKEMHGLHQFALQWHQSDTDEHGNSMFALQNRVFNAGDEEVVEEWVRRCRQQQRKTFREWSDAELGKWMQAAGGFGEEEPLVNCGISADTVVDHVLNDESKQLKRALVRVGLHRDSFDDVWSKLLELLKSDLGSGLTDHAQDSPAGTSKDEFYLHVPIDSGWTRKDLLGFCLSDGGDETRFIVNKIKKRTAAASVEGACEGMQLIRIKGSHLEKTIQVQSLSFAAGMAQLSKAFLALQEEDSLTMIFKLPWETQEDEGHDTYYWNKHTDETTWDAPEEVMIAKEAMNRRRVERDLHRTIKINPISPWVGYFSEESCEPYYVREDTEESVWEVPRAGISRWGDGNMLSEDAEEATEDGDPGSNAQGELLPSESGELTVKVVNCRDLIAADGATTGGLSDPYVKLTLGGKNHFETECQRNTVDPEFNVDALFPISADDSRDALKLRVEVWDWDKGSSDDFIGMVELSLPCLFSGGWTDNADLAKGKLFQLKDPSSQVDPKAVERKRKLIANRSSTDRRKIKALLQDLDKKALSFDKDNLYGAIRLELSFEPGQGKSRRPASAGRLQVTEISCRQILPTSSSDMSSTYCEFWLANKPKSKQVTSVCKKTLDPRWFEEPGKPWEFVVTESAEEDLTLHAHIKSKSSGSLLGQCKIDLTREFADGWTPNAKPTAKSLLSDPYGNVRKRDIERVRKAQFKGSECATEDLYGSINITMVFRQDDVSRNSLALASVPSSLPSSEIRPVGILSMKILGAKGGFLTDERRNRTKERNLYFQVTALKDDVDVLPVPKRSKMVSMGTTQELQIKGRHLSRTTFELESSKGRPDVVRVACFEEGDTASATPTCLGVCEIDIRHKSEKAWIAPEESSAVDFKPTVQRARLYGAEDTGGHDHSDPFRLDEERCTVLRADMTPHADDYARINSAKRKQEDDQRRRRRAGPGRGRRGSETSGTTGEPLNWLTVSMSWNPADTPARVERTTDVTGVWHATMNMMPTGEGTDYDVELNPNSPWVGIWQEGKPYFFNETTRENLDPELDEPDEGIKEWKMRPGTMAGPGKERKRRGKNRSRKRHSPQQGEEFFFLYQETQSDDCIVISGHEANVQVTSEDPEEVEWQGAEAEHRFTIRNARLLDDQLIFEMVREPEEGLFSDNPEVTRWEASLNFASRRLYNGKISGARCGTFEATRPPTHICEQTRTIPLQKLCPELTAQYSSDASTGRAATAPARTISLRPLQSGNAIADKMELQLQPTVADDVFVTFSKDVADAVRTLAAPDDSLRKSAFKSAKQSLTKQAFRHHEDDTTVKLLEANPDMITTNVEISKQRHKRGWMGSLHVVSEQAVDWRFSLRMPKFRSLEVVIETLELDDDDLDGRKVWCAVGRPYKSANTAHSETRKLEVFDGVVEWRDPDDRPVLKILEPADPSYCLVDICASSRTLGTVRVPIPKNTKVGEESVEDFEATIESDELAGTLSGYVQCTYEEAECKDSLDFSIWFCQSGQQLAREVVPRHRCLERSGKFISRTAGQLLYLVEDELWNPARVSGAHSAPPCKGKFLVKVIQARDLIAADPTGQSDPYVKLRILNTRSNDPQEQKTGVVKRQLNPTFMEDFDFDVDTDGSLELHVEVWDQDVLEQDDFLGEVKIPLADAMNAGVNSELGMAWLLRPPAPLFYQLEDPQDESKKVPEDKAKYCLRRRGEPLGAIQLAFGFSLSRADRKPPPAEYGILNITLEQCLDLLPAKMDPKPSSQPFVRFKCGKESKQTKVSEEASLSPEWRGADCRYQLTIGQDMESQQDLEVEVYNNERPAKMLGCCTINLPTLFYYGWEQSDPPTLVHQLGPGEQKDGKEKANYEYLVNKRKIMKNPDRTVTNVDNPDNEYGAIRMKVEYSRSRGRHSPGRSRWSSSKPTDDVPVRPAGTLRVVAARALLQHKSRESYLSLRIWVDERKTTQQPTDVAITQTEGRSKTVNWNKPMEFDVPHGEQRLYVEIYECADSSGRRPTLLDSGDLEFSMISGLGYDPVNLESGDVVLQLKVHYMAAGMTGVWKVKKDDDDDGQTTDLMMLKEAKDGRITGSCVWDDSDDMFQPFDIPSGERDRDTNLVEFEQQYDDDGSSANWKATLRNSKLQGGEYDGDYQGTFTAKQLPNANSKSFRLELATEELDNERRGEPSKELIQKAHFTGVTKRLHSHCEQRGARKPRQMRHRLMALDNLPPTPLAVESAYATYGLALEEYADQEPQNFDPTSFGLWPSKGEVDDDASRMPFEDLNDEFKELLRQDKADAPQHQRYCNAGNASERGYSKHLPPPPWLLDAAERAAMAELSHGHEHVAERKVKDVLHAGAQLALKLIGAGVSQITEITGGGGEAEIDDSDADDPEPESEPGRRRSRSRSRSHEGGTEQLLYAVRTRSVSDSNGHAAKFDAPPPSPKSSSRRSRSPSTEGRRSKRSSVDEANEDAYSQGDTVEVFSKGAKQWLEAEVISTNGVIAKVRYSKEGQDTEKSLAVDSADLRQIGRRAASRVSLSSPSSRLSLSPAKGASRDEASKLKDVTLENRTEETLMLHFDDGNETKKVKKGKSVRVQMRKGDEIWATANGEQVWGPEKLGRDREFIIDGDLMSWIGSAGSSQGSEERSMTKSSSEKKQKKKKKKEKEKKGKKNRKQ